MISFESVTKTFPGALALSGVSFEIAPGTCHALCGENGAGKSTIARILAGIHAPDSGRVVIDGAPVQFSSPHDALAAGIAIVHQELSFCDNLSVAENLALGSLPARAGFVSKVEMRRRARELVGAIDPAIDVDRPVSDLTIGQQQMLQIAMAIGRGARVVIFDEPTSSLSQHEAERLYALIDRLKARGVTSIYVTHRLEEIFRLTDAVTVLRDGHHVATQRTAAMTEGSIVELMIGRRLDQYFPAHVHGAPTAELLRVERLSGPSGFRDISFSVRAGEVVGLAGLVGSGRSEVARAIFGIDRVTKGTIYVRGTAVTPASPSQAIGLGIGLVPEDRKKQGLVAQMSVLTNGAMAVLGLIGRWGFVSRGAERRATGAFFERLGVSQARFDGPVAALSGGNQQKVVLTRWLAARCPILIVDEPTRGVDVGAKAEIHALIDELAAAGSAILLISSEMPEILHLSTRVLVFRQGRVVGELDRSAASADALMRLMAGVAA